MLAREFSGAKLGDFGGTFSHLPSSTCGRRWARDAPVERGVAADIHRSFGGNEVDAEPVHDDLSLPALAGNQFHIEGYRLSGAQH